MKQRILFITLILAVCSLNAQIASGPMLGYADLREVLIWIQTDEASRVRIDAHPSMNVHNLKTVSVYTGEANIAKLVFSDLEPGTEYHYVVYVNGTAATPEGANSFTFSTQELWQWRSDPPSFTLATGSCNYINQSLYDRPGEPYGGGYEIFNTIAAMDPDLMLWLGDNIYLREVDYGSRSGIIHRYNHTRSTPELQELLRACPHYAIWDDHDFGPDNADRSYIHKDWTLNAFKLFWGNPSYGIPGENGITGSFSVHDVDFFLMDNRTFRTNYELKTTGHQIWGDEQIDWLIESLKYSKASFKIVASGGQFLSDAPLYENHAQYADERANVLRRLDEEGIEGVIFLTGDRHHTELSEMTLPGGATVWDLTASPLTSKAYDHENEPNTLRVEGTVVGERNFAMLTFAGKLTERACTIKVFNKDGVLLWERMLRP